jgi:hypothetical protein
MAVFGEIPNPEVDIDAPVKSSTAKKLRDNLYAITEGDPTALAAGRGVSIEKGGQTSIITDDVDVTKSLTPDGLGGAKWTSGVSGMVLVERIEVAVATTRVDFTGLDGDVDEVYRLVARLWHNSSFGSSDLIMTKNGGVLLGNTLLVETGVPRGDTIGRFYADAGVVNDAIQIDMLIHARQTVAGQDIPRVFQGKVVEAQTFQAIRVTEFMIADSGLGNYTSLELGAGANRILPGSVVELFKLSQG